MVETIPMSTYSFEPMMLAPLEAQSEEGPVLVCGLHDFQWAIILAAEGRELWKATLADMRVHVGDHGHHRAGESA
jgi:hypothetical protein